jgi:hypothetical protein
LHLATAGVRQRPLAALILKWLGKSHRLWFFLNSRTRVTISLALQVAGS